jgi:5-methylcytosine-specific restriction endonuclease McrA
LSGWYARNRHRYPFDWDRIAKRIKDAAEWRCEACEAEHGKPPHVLTVDHLDHRPENCEPENLIALCQRCHLRRQGMTPLPRSRDEAIRRLRMRAHADRAQGELFK